MTMNSSETNPTEIIATPSWDYRIRRLLIAVMFLGMAGWFAYDGWVKYPRQNLRYAKARGDEEAVQRLDEEFKNTQKHSDTSIRWQRNLAIMLPFGALAMAIWAFYSSRGVYRFADNTLHVPGHPPVPLDAIVRIDQRKWDRKGIAYIDYELQGKPGRLKLDDYIYDRKPTDEIHKIITDSLASEAQPTVDGN
jgi:hypothetical protein